MKTLRIHKNIYGNYVCFIGRERVTDFGEEQDAKEWAAKLVKRGEGYHVSDKSDVSANDIAIWIHNWL